MARLMRSATIAGVIDDHTSAQCRHGCQFPHGSPTAMQFQSAMTDFFSVMVAELVTGTRSDTCLPDGSRIANI